MKTIISRQHPEIKAISELKLAKKRKEKKQFLAEGVRTLKALLTRYTPIQLYVTSSMFDKLSLSISNDLITLVSDPVMQKISSSKTPPGIIGVFHIPSKSTAPLTAGLVLANVTNPGNMGTLIRTAAAMNIKTVVVVEGVDPWSPKVIQATAGTIAFVHIYELNWQELLKEKKELSLCALVVTGGKAPKELSFKNSLIVVGNEATGILQEWLNDCDTLCTLPMSGQTESLNAAVAGSIVLYLASRTKSD